MLNLTVGGEAKIGVKLLDERALQEANYQGISVPHSFVHFWIRDMAVTQRKNLCIYLCIVIPSV